MSMTVTVFFVRHGAHDDLGRRLTGRGDGVGLTEAGREQIRLTGTHLARCRPNLIYVSPIRRTQESAAIIGSMLGLVSHAADALAEIDFGAWTGLEFSALQGDPAWNRWNQARSQHRPPGGESMLEAQTRISTWLSYVIARHPNQAIVAISHSDIIKAALAYGLGLSLDHHDRLDIDPGSVSVMVAGNWGVKVQSMNERPA